MKYKSKVTRVTNETLATLGNRVIETVNNSGIEEAVDSKQFQQLLEVNASYQEATNPLNVKQMSSDINNSFDERYRLFQNLIIYIKGMTLSNDEEVRNAALKIWVEISKFRMNFSKLRKADMTLRYIRIIESLKMTELADAILKVKLTEKLNALEAVQLEYESLYINRGNLVAGKVTPSNLRKEMEKALKKHLDETAYLSEKYETEAWKTLNANLRKRFDEVSVTMPEKQKPESPAEDVPETETA